MTKAVVGFVFPPEPSKWLFSVSVPGGSEVQDHVAVTETTEADGSWLVFPLQTSLSPGSWAQECLLP